METGYVKQISEKIITEVKKVIVEQDILLENCLISLLSGGHVLLEGVPGLAKTLLVRAFAKTINVDFKRIQFTPDLMPSDITGTKIYNMQNREFDFKRGPIFTNFLLADEINRTPPKTQAGLLEAMEEQTVSVDGEKISLSSPFMVFATQNPIEYEGTYSLPEALLDRFIMKVIVEYPSIHAEKEIVLRHHNGFKTIDLDQAGVAEICNSEDIIRCQKEIQNVNVDEEIINYMVEIVSETRKHQYIGIGSSPRGSIALLHLSKAYAAIKGRAFVIPEDVKRVALSSLRHRITLKPEVEIEGVKVDKVLNNILSKVKVPR